MRCLIYDKYGSFTVKISKYDMINRAYSSETLTIPRAIQGSMRISSMI